MKENVKELISTIQEDGLDEICVEDFGLTIEGDKVTHAIVVDMGKGMELALTSGDPAGKHTVYWNSSECENNAEFDDVVTRINYLY